MRARIAANGILPLFGIKRGLMAARAAAIGAQLLVGNRVMIGGERDMRASVYGVTSYSGYRMDTAWIPSASAYGITSYDRVDTGYRLAHILCQ